MGLLTPGEIVAEKLLGAHDPSPNPSPTGRREPDAGLLDISIAGSIKRTNKASRYSPKMLNAPKDAQPEKVSAFGLDERLWSDDTKTALYPPNLSNGVKLVQPLGMDRFADVGQVWVRFAWLGGEGGCAAVMPIRSSCAHPEI